MSELLTIDSSLPTVGENLLDMLNTAQKPKSLILKLNSMCLFRNMPYHEAANGGVL